MNIMLRWTGQVTIFLLIGAIVNVAVAWGFALVDRDLDFFGRFDGIETGFWYGGASIESFCLDVPGEFWACQKPKRWVGSGIFQTWWEGPDAEAEMHKHIPPWSLFRQGDPIVLLAEHGELRDIDYSERATGWPMLAFRYTRVDELKSNGQLTLVSSDGLLLLPWVPAGWRSDLPLRPLWRGFAVNTILCAGLLWVVVAGLIALCRERRTRRGLCPSCRYPRGTSPVCTECGELLPIQAAK